MSINKIYTDIVQGDSNDENLLFETLSVRFRLILQHKLKDKQDIEDILQETMLNIAQKYKTIDFNISFSAWAYKVLENNLLNFYRKNATKKRKQSDLTDNILAAQQVTPDPLVKMKLLDCFRKLCNVNKKYSEIIKLHYLGFKIEEICDNMKLSKNNVYVLLSRARTLLKTCLEKGDIA